MKKGELSLILLERTLKNNLGDVLVLTPVRRGQWASRAQRSKRGGVEKNGVVLREQYEQVFRAEPSTSLTKQSWGCTGFDAVIGKSGLRVRALFSVINEHLKRNDKSNVVYANFGQRLAA